MILLLLVLVDFSRDFVAWQPSLANADQAPLVRVTVECVSALSRLVDTTVGAQVGFALHRLGDTHTLPGVSYFSCVFSTLTNVHIHSKRSVARSTPELVVVRELCSRSVGYDRNKLARDMGARIVTKGICCCCKVV